MSRYRDDVDDYYGGGGRPARREESRYDDRGESRRGDYDGRSVGPPRGGGGDDDYGRARSGERLDNPSEGRRGERVYDDYPRSGGGGGDQYRGERKDYGPPPERVYSQTTYGPTFTRGGRRGASRSHVRCRDIMTRDVTVATRDATITEVAAMMRDEDTGVIPVVDRAEATTPSVDTGTQELRRAKNGYAGNGKLVGLITDRDIVVRAIAEGLDTHTTRAEEIMTTDIHTAQPNDRVIDVIRKMGDKQVRRIPVVDRDGSLRGIISMADVALETEEDRELADALEEISSGSSFWSKVFG
ncbi:MAG: CBS domain-containing protein [Acidobacteriota bacterium]|nr:CBS domain-containing protein [Acidobacteriota bacterium]